MDKAIFDNRLKALFNEGFSNAEMAEKLDVSISSIKRKLKELGLKNTPERKSLVISRRVKQLYKEGKLVARKGSDNPATRPEVIEKIRKYNLDHQEELKAKREQTCLERYGVKNVFELKETQKKIKTTNLRKYGSASPMKNPEIAGKAGLRLSKSLADKYNHSERKQALKREYERLGRKLKPSEMEKLWGLSQSNAYLFMRANGLEEYIVLEENQLELEVKTFLQDNGIKFEQHNRSIISPKELDFYIPDYHLALEINDIRTHNSTNSPYQSPKERNYHYHKSLACEQKGVRLIHIWEYEWKNSRQRPILESIILGACNKAKTIYARKCQVEVRESSQMKDFFEKNNIQGFRGGKFAICLVYEGEVVMSYIMGHPFFGKGKYEWEVIRGATKLNYRVIGGASKIWKYFIRNYSPKNCVYYVDFNYFNGGSLPFLNTKYIKTNPGVKNYFVETGQIKNRDPIHHHLVKQLIQENKVWEIWNAGTKVYLWEREN